MTGGPWRIASPTIGVLPETLMSADLTSGGWSLRFPGQSVRPLIILNIQSRHTTPFLHLSEILLIPCVSFPPLLLFLHSAAEK